MPVSIFAGCTEYCGWIAGIVTILGHGSYGVPIKAATSKLDVHPLVMQSYKTFVCFLTCWLVILMGEEVRFTPWGIVSGLFWVPGASFGIYAIRNAGLAIAVGIWSSINVLSSFIWGILVFEERVKSVEQTAAAFLVLVIGLVGMARYAKPPTSTTTTTKEGRWSIGKSASTFEDSDSDTVSSDGSDGSLGRQQQQQTKRKQRLQPPSPRSMELPSHFAASVVVSAAAAPRSVGFDIANIQPLLMEQGEEEVDAAVKHASSKDRFVYFGGRLALTRRELGILGAAFNGAWGGLTLIPMHHVKKQGFGGASYLISFATGALIVNTIMWIGMFVWYWNHNNKRWNFRDACKTMPSFHLRKLWWPGLLAGSLYSLGNFGSILCVTYLGQGVGYSLCQAQLLVSGLWGIFYYEEIQGRRIIFKWFASALLTIVGILVLTYEHDGRR